MMFDNILTKGYMTQGELDDFFSRCSEAGIRFDTNTMIYDTFKETDILISDYSSVISLFLATGKPLIYCVSSETAYANTIFNKLMEVMYIASSWEDVELCLEELTAGRDKLAEERSSVVDSVLLYKPNAVADILNAIISDYTK